MEGITRLHNFYFTGTQRFMSDVDAINLFTQDTACELTYQQGKYCLSYCKMTIKDEMADFEKYRKVAPVELYEMIGRAAEIKFAGTEYEDEPLHVRIEMVLDLLFPLVRFKRKEVTVGEESESQSDEDY